MNTGPGSSPKRKIEGYSGMSVDMKKRNAAEIIPFPDHLLNGRLGRLCIAVDYGKST